MHFALFLTAVVAFQQPDPIAPLTTDQTNAMARIDAGRVTETISFLSSDELAGRDTPSRELNISAAYVAARFRGAGLEGLGKNGSYYQETTVDVVQTPGYARLSDAQGNPIQHLGVLTAGSKPLTYSGQFTVVDLNNMPGKLDGPIIVKMTERLSPAQNPLTLIRRLVRTRSNGATAAIIQVEPDSPLIEMARRNQTRSRMQRRRASSGLPTILVPVDTALTEDLSLSIPAQIVTKAVVRNVIAVRRGTDPELAKQAIVFSAHLDHIGRSNGLPDPINNGADDDASGVTGVLSLADSYGALSKSPARSVIFMTFWGEEKGLLGSRYFVENPLWPLQNITANINIEMIGRPEQDAREKAWVTGWEHSSLGDILNTGSSRVGIPIFDHPRFSKMLYARSDNYSFVARGVIAHSISAGSLHSDYHQPGDEWEKLDIPHMTRVIQGIFAGSLPIADGLMTPKKSN